MLEGMPSSSVWAFYWAVQEILMTRIAPSKPGVPFSSTYFDLFFSSQRRWSVFQSFYQYSPLFVLFSSFLFLLDFSFPLLSLCSAPTPFLCFPHPAHLLRDPSLCLPVEAGWKNRQPLCFSDSHHIACMPAPLHSLTVLSLLFCQFTSANPVTTPTLCPPPSPHLPCHTSVAWQAHSTPTMLWFHSFHLSSSVSSIAAVNCKTGT